MMLCLFQSRLAGSDNRFFAQVCVELIAIPFVVTGIAMLVSQQTIFQQTSENNVHRDKVKGVEKGNKTHQHAIK